MDEGLGSSQAELLEQSGYGSRGNDKRYSPLYSSDLSSFFLFRRKPRVEDYSQYCAHSGELENSLPFNFCLWTFSRSSSIFLSRVSSIVAAEASIVIYINDENSLVICVFYEPDGLFVLISSKILLAFSKCPCSPRPFAFLNIAL